MPLSNDLSSLSPGGPAPIELIDGGLWLGLASRSLAGPLGSLGIGAASHMDTFTVIAPRLIIPTQIAEVPAEDGVIHSGRRACLALPQFDQARTDFAIIEDELEAIDVYRHDSQRALDVCALTNSAL